MNIDAIDPNNPYFNNHINKICAICAEQLQQGTTYPLKTEINHNESTKVYEVIESFSKFKFNVNGSLFICMGCFYRTASAYAFQQMCNKAQYYYENYLLYLQQQKQHQETTALHVQNVTIKQELDIEETTVQIHDSLSDTRKTDFEKSENIEEYDVEHEDIEEIELKPTNVCKVEDECENKDEEVNCEDLEDQRKHAFLANISANTEACEVCNKVISCSYMHIHMRIHTGDQQFRCNLCDKTFVLAATLKKHMRLHNQEKSYKCTYCDAAYWEKWDLAVHINKHENRRDFVCKLCGKSFLTRSNFNQHEKLHSDERPYACELCDKTFKMRRCLRLHMLVHTGEKPHVCEHCGKSFSQKGHLVVHMRIHTGEKPYSCQLCGKAFTLAQTLKFHLQSHARKASIGKEVKMHLPHIPPPVNSNNNNANVSELS